MPSLEDGQQQHTLSSRRRPMRTFALLPRFALKSSGVLATELLLFPDALYIAFKQYNGSSVDARSNPQMFASEATCGKVENTGADILKTFGLMTLPMLHKST
jgi:hypothetical protein